METTADSAKVMRTKRLLANKLVELMKKKSLRKISIKELCQSTQLSRAAFYLYFEDKYQLLRFCFEDEKQEWIIATQGKSLDEFISYMMDGILEKKDFYYHLIADDPEPEQLEIIRYAFTSLLAERLQEREKSSDESSDFKAIVCAFCVAGIIGANKYWIEQNFHIPKETVVACHRMMLAHEFE